MRKRRNGARRLSRLSRIPVDSGAPRPYIRRLARITATLNMQKQSETLFVNPRDIARKWYLIDARDIPLGRVAARVATVVRGKHRPYFTPHQEVGDHVIVINAKHVALTGRKREQKTYYRHSGYPGGLKSTTYEKVVARKPNFPMEQAVRGMLPKGRLGRKLFHNVKIYPDGEHPHVAQQPEAMTL